MKHGQRKTDVWFPFFIDKWLFGSTRYELEPDEQSAWLDLLVLSKKDDGFIRANEVTPYPITQLAAFFNKPEELIRRTIKKLLNPKVGKLEEPMPGIYYVPSQESYELSDRQKRRIKAKETDPMSAKPDTMAEKADVRREKNSLEENRIEDIKSCLSGLEIDKLFKEFWEAYPRDGREAKVEARKKFGARVKEGNLKKIILALNNYNDFLRYEKNVNHFERRAMGAKTFLHERWKEFVGLKIEPPL